jgi:hypothetical protein
MTASRINLKKKKNTRKEEIRLKRKRQESWKQLNSGKF